MSKNDGPYREAPPRAPLTRNWRWAIYCALALASGVPAGVLARGVGAAAYGWATKPSEKKPCVERFARTPSVGYSAECDPEARLEVVQNGEMYRCHCPGGTP